jgi:hypothetical protein
MKTMNAPIEPEPWEQLRDLLAQNEGQSLAAFLNGLSSGDTVRTVFRLTSEGY